MKTAVDYVIAQAGYGRYASQVDAEFERNYAECKKHKIPVGAYWFSYAVSPDDARQEARACMEVLKGKQFEYPIYFDIEGSACSGRGRFGKVQSILRRARKGTGTFFRYIYQPQPCAESISKRNTALHTLRVACRIQLDGAALGGGRRWYVARWFNGAVISGISEMLIRISVRDLSCYDKKGRGSTVPKPDPEPMDTDIWWKKGDKG